ncbi:MAG: dockerin type I repeat-containing protein [Armatimonadota bacterium]|nr:dockerin type I repeat-containing protein [Armatimonadota bacterium]
MRRTYAILGVVALGALLSAHAQVQFTHIKSLDLTSYFNGQALGSVASDVAFDGANLYVAGYATGTTNAPVGVLKISNALALDPNQLGYTQLISLTQAAQSRVSSLVYYDGFIYLGTGLGDGSNNPDNTGIRKFDATTGTQVSNWNNTGVILPSALRNSTRADSLELDPGFANDPSRAPALGIVSFNRGFVFRRDLATGDALADILTPPSRDCQGGQLFTTVRDVAFSPEGDVYLRLAQFIFYAPRTGAGTVVGSRACQIADFRPDSDTQVSVNLHYLRVGERNFLVYNRRDPNNRQGYARVFIVQGAGATWDFTNPVATLTGDEPLPNGTTPSAYNFDIFNFTSGFGVDPSKGDVNLDGVVNNADLLQILFDFGSSNPAADVNSDGTVNNADLLVVLFNFGSSPRAQYLFVVHSSIGTDRLDIYRVDSN